MTEQCKHVHHYTYLVGLPDEAGAEVKWVVDSCVDCGEVLSMTKSEGSDE